MEDSDYNNASTTARAFATYALVPYLGILFCPGALVMAGVGVYQSYREPDPASRNSSYAIILVSMLVLCAQLALWWILYKAPVWARGF